MYIKSPLNYTGGKYKILKPVLAHFRGRSAVLWIYLPGALMWELMWKRTVFSAMTRLLT